MNRSGILVFGQSGQVARELAGLPGVTTLGRDLADLADPRACAALIEQTRPRAVINAAAYTQVDRAEEEEALATRINADAPGAMARAAAGLGIPFVQISTDYVFDGSGTRPWAETDAPAPLGAYGRSKLSGEQAVAAAGGVHAIIRTSWVFSATGRNFVKSMLALSAARERLSVVGDQTGGPTPAAAIARACADIAESLATGRGESGVFHFAGYPDESWADFARTIFTAAGRNVAVDEITSAEFGAPAPRPANSRLNCEKIARVFSISRPDWQQALAGVLDELKGQDHGAS